MGIKKAIAVLLGAVALSDYPSAHDPFTFPGKKKPRGFRKARRKARSAGAFLKVEIASCKKMYRNRHGKK